MDKPIDKINLYKDIVELSFMGDIRLYFKAEIKDKTLNVVLGAEELYDEIYSKYFKLYDLDRENLIKTLELTFKNDLEKQKLIKMCVENLPKEFINEVQKYKNLDRNIDMAVYLSRLENSNRNELINSYIKQLNLRTSIFGIFTALISTDFNKIVRFIK